MSSPKRKALGKGFGALIPPADHHQETNPQQEILISEIQRNPKQPRTYFDEDKIKELAQSIKIKGVIQPIVVRKIQSGYEIVVGERRFLAAQKAGLEKVPVIIKKISDTELREIALIENIQREDLNPIEEGQAYLSLMDEHQYTQEVLSQRLGKNRSTIANLMRLLKLPKKIQTGLIEKQISVGHARSLLSIEETERMEQLFDEIIAHDLTVRDIEKKVNELQNVKTKVNKPDVSDKRQYLYNAKKLENQFATSVKILEKNNKGKIEFHFHSIEEFNSIFDKLLKQT